MKAEEPRQNRIPFMMSDQELAAVDEWRFQNRIGTRADAIRRLTAMAIFLDRQIQMTDDFRQVMWRRFDIGTAAVLDATKAEDPDWKSIALTSLQVLGELAEPQAALSHAVHGMAEVAARMREDRNAVVSIAAAQKAETDAKERLRTLRSHFSASQDEPT
jgi:hypothetical protein